MSFIAWLLAFFIMENLVTTWGTGTGFALLKGSRSIRKEVLTTIYLVMSVLLAWVFRLVLVDILDLEYLIIVPSVLLAWFLPMAIRFLFQPLMPEASDWEQGRDYSYSASVVLMFVLGQYRLDVLSTLGAALGASVMLSLTIALYRSIMTRLHFEQVPRRFHGLPLSLIVLGVLGMVFAGMDAMLAEARIVSLFNV